MNWPQTVIDAARKAAAASPDDISAATEHAERAIRRLPEFKDLANALIRHGVQQIVYDVRHVANVQIRRETNGYGIAAKVKGDSEAVERAFRSVYEYHIAGMTLGNIKGADLNDIGNSEREKAEGHEFNAKLCDHLAKLVPEDKTVRETMTEKKLRQIFERLQAA